MRTGEPAATRYFGKPAFDWIAETPEQFSEAMTGGLCRDMVAGYQLLPGRTVADISGSGGSLLAELIGDRPNHGIMFDGRRSSRTRSPQ